MLKERERFWYKVLCLRYVKEGGRLCFKVRGGSKWWQNLNKIRTGVGMLDEGYLLYNI